MSGRFILITFLIILGFCFSGTLGAQQNLPEGENLVLATEPAKMKLDKRPIGEVKAFRNKDGQTVLRLMTAERPQNIYSLSRGIPLKKVNVAAGQALLISFQARTISASLETREAKVQLQLKQSNSHKDNIKRTLSIANDWRTYYVPVVTTIDVAKGELSLAVQFGYPPQELLLRDLKLTLFGKEVALADLPRTRITYTGRSADAPWRLEAARRIERHRKGSFSLQFVDEDGDPITGAEVAIELERHHFRWGAAVNAQRIAADPARLDRIAQSFNTVVFENDLKIKAWGNKEKQATTLAIIDSLAAKGIQVKGHTLIWPGFRYLPQTVRQQQHDPEAVTQIIEDHVSDILRKTSGKIGRWDVVNEAFSNQDLQNITGSEEILYEGFRTVAKMDPEAQRFVNEFGIINRGGHNEVKQAWYRDFVQRVDVATGGLVDGIGIQCHMGADLTPPERVLEILDIYVDLDKDISISEFTIDLDDPELRFDYTRDFITVAFSHPKVTEFLFWGWYGKTHPKATLFNDDWKAGDMGAAFFQLINQVWTTKMAASTDVGGRIQGKGFYGSYRYEVTCGEEVLSGTFTLDPSAPLLDQIVVPCSR